MAKDARLGLNVARRVAPRQRESLGFGRFELECQLLVGVTIDWIGVAAIDSDASRSAGTSSGGDA